MRDEATILVIEDEPSLAELLSTILTTEGFRVCSAMTGEDGLRQALQAPPGLILLDLNLPVISGFEVLRALRTNAKTLYIPVVILSARKDIQDKLAAFEMFVNDYLTKPFDGDELLARVRAHMHHARSPLLSPLTQLPGGVLVEFAISQRLADGAPWAFLYLDLDHFKALNDAYGFHRGNEMILLLTRAVTQGVRDHGNPPDFIGHIGGEDFVVLTTPDRVHPLCQAIIRRFEEESRRFYRAEDLARGAFYAQGRDGQAQYFALVTLSIAVVCAAAGRPVRDVEHLSRIAAGVKQRSKAVQGDCYIIDGDPQIHRVQTGAMLPEG